MKEQTTKYFDVTETVSDLENMLQFYRDTKLALQPTLDELKELEKAIKSLVIETGELALIEGAAVSIRQGYTRKTWDGKALTGYGAAHPEIMQFCKEREIGPAAVIKVK